MSDESKNSERLNLRVAVVIAHYGPKNEAHLARVLAEWRGMGDLGIEANLTVLTERDLRPGENPAALPFKARPLLVDQMREDTDLDLFIYSEDDILITAENLRAWCGIEANWMLRAETPGLVRYEVTESGEKRFPDMHGSFHWENVEKRGDLRLAEYTNVHQGCYILPRWQLRTAIASGGFLVGMHSTPVYGALECGASDPFLQCGLRRLIRLDRFEDLLIHHLPNNYLHLGKPEAEVRAELAALGVEWRKP